MSSFKTTLFLLLTLPITLQAQKQTIIPFEISDYGLIFTDVIVNGEKVKAMIDFGQPHLLMLSSSLVAKHEMETKKSDKIGYDIDGNEMAFYEGKANELLIQGLSIKSVGFSSSPNEMESVSEQIGTRFDAAIGWGFFSKYFFTLNYSAKEITLFAEAQKLEGSFQVDYDKNGSYMMLNTQLAKKEARLIIDTGAPVSTLHDQFITDQKPEKNAWGQPSHLLKTKIGKEKLDVEYELRDLSVLKPLEVVGIIGGDLLQQYVISIDPNEQTMYWKRIG